MNYKELPKVELHVHLDCCLSFEVVQQLEPGTDLPTYKEAFIAPDKCMDLADYISRADRGIDLMQTEEQLRLVTLDLLKQLKDDHVIYAEIRFAPLEHTRKGLSADEVVVAVNEAIIEGCERYGIEAGLLLCTLRHYSEEQGLETANLAKRFCGSSMVVGFDLAADEAGFPIDKHILPFRTIRNHPLGRTAHAGEAKGAASVWESLRELLPVRIGHGVRSVEDPELLAFLIEKDIHLEVCPTSNIQTDVFDKMEDHSINTLYKAGVSVGLNTDARTISNISLSDEYQKMADVFGWNREHFKRCNLEALRHAFLSEQNKGRLKARLEAGYSR